MSIVATNKVVSIHYTLTSDSGEQLDTSIGSEPLEYLHGAENIVPGLEKGLEGKKVGDKAQVKVEAAEGYGERDDEGVFQVSRAQFPKGAKLHAGMQVGAQGPDGGPVPAWITAVNGDQITLDFNHPLAGKQLNFAVEILAVRDATTEELEHGHPHGPDGHHHH